MTHEPILSIVKYDGMAELGWWRYAVYYTEYN